jgi:hypothetical protein
MSGQTIMVNRAPVLTLWATVVATRLGYERETALTLGKAVAGLNAQSKGRMLGIFGAPKAPESGAPPKKTGLGEDSWLTLCDRAIPVKNTEAGLRAVVKDQPIDPAKVESYLKSKFGEDLVEARKAMQDLADSYPPDELASAAYSLYARFRPNIPPGEKGWGVAGKLDLDHIRSLKRA